MGRFDLGVFVDAHHLFDVGPHEQSASVVLSLIEAAAEEQCMSYGVANRLVVADCSDGQARDIAEDFGTHGFVIRHVPRDAPLTRASVLTAEIVQATVGREELRTVAVVADPEVPLSVADALHRAGRALIACMAGHTRGIPAVDRVINLALDRDKLRPLIHAAASSLIQSGREEVQVHEFAGVLRSLQPGFEANAYGMQLKKLVQQLSGPEFHVLEPDRIVLRARAAPGASRQKAQIGMGASSLNGEGSGSSLTRTMREAAQVLPTISPINEDSVVQALRSVLGVAADRHQLRDAAIEQGLSIQVVCAGLGVVANGYAKLGHKTLELCHQAVAGTAWRVERNESQPEQIRLWLTADPTAPA
ncbi:hypothetical protein GCM10022403_019670 [Streptomyces coacervatus]|uniref:NYN domain-containing protein n=1 Tax=Streptomyces coacervatus TaxID=647381 RepID=A0ABP7H790_9ACTN|nr:hypothetical protein [Streptomyces coacervatus]MDF2267444.1 hypothetical protein [Streptomyces coacervatus]